MRKIMKQKANPSLTAIVILGFFLAQIIYGIILLHLHLQIAH